MDVYIQDCVRTPRGKARDSGGLASYQPHELVGHLIGALEQRNAVSKQNVESLTLGCVGQINAQGGHIALTSKILNHLPENSTAHTVNNFCASGLSAIGLATATIAAGFTKTALAGGVEMLSRVPFMADEASYYSDKSLPPLKQYIPVALAADLLARQNGIARETLDEIALRSQNRAEAAEENTALLSSRIATSTLDRDEAIRPTNMETLQMLEPAFGAFAQPYASALDGQDYEPQMTKSHAPPMADGAGLALLGGAGVFNTPRARIISFVEQGGNDRESLLAGIAAMKEALMRANLDFKDIDRIEFMEAFAPTVAIFEREFQPDISKVNVGGGHIAKGHPMGATGAVLLSTLMDALDECRGRYGLVVVTGAQGVGAAMIIERLH
ncbi:acetyl-CoA C-acetyltransferase/acetyl-CoA acyltransferase [Litorimonas taeanensis]|uniref:Acetyl-CoA C-acetyltransferase/acetyl-CoA acyltransferase n=1 Tax=Litorimonas taeanensis TaxID=568099 RepID=A0A420WMS2_9PROT|nr:acetyl-CoA C-acyltransferase [Litorimonas taeanensis]RKQ72185.1 acetyl-CoA C-acetyltransferase/acetyl-CoA acyltransferase [Litorimonas taeanensis]